MLRLRRFFAKFFNSKKQGEKKKNEKRGDTKKVFPTKEELRYYRLE
jgi:hypothetical protein